MPLYREDLDDPPAPCAGPHGEEAGSHGADGGPDASPGAGAPEGGLDLWFHAKCHLDSPTWARYRDGILTIQCARCERDVVAVVVASRA